MNRIFVPPDFSPPSFVCEYESIHATIQTHLVQKMVMVSKKLRVSEDHPTNMMDRFVKTSVVKMGLGAVPVPHHVPHKRKRKFELDEEDAIDPDLAVCAYCGARKYHDRSHATLICTNTSCSHHGIAMNMSLQIQQPKMYKRERDYMRFPNAKPKAPKSASRQRTEPMYKQQTHMLEVMRRRQGKQRKVIPDFVYEGIFETCNIMRMTDRTKLTQQDIHDILKYKLGLVEWCPHVVKIHAQITGITPWQLTDEEEQELLDSFETVKQHFPHCRGSRKSMYSYNYILHKRCEILAYIHQGTEQGERWKKSQEIFPLLKNGLKRNDLDVLWEPLCERAGWPFIPTSTFDFFVPVFG